MSPPSSNHSTGRLPFPDDTPFYHCSRPSLLTGISDQVLALVGPVIAYWALSLLFHFLDTSGWRWLEKYRIHESSEVQSRNRASRSQVIWAVLLQQATQTTLGLYWISGDTAEINHREKMENIARFLESAAKRVFGMHARKLLLDS